MQRYVEEAFAVPGAGSQVGEADVAVGVGGSSEIEAEVGVFGGIGARADGGGSCGWDGATIAVLILLERK